MSYSQAKFILNLQLGQCLVTPLVICYIPEMPIYLRSFTAITHTNKRNP